jgi:hypothetical protein
VLVAETPLMHIKAGQTGKAAPAGTDAVLHTFSDIPNGENPLSELIRDSSGNLYGTTQYACGLTWEGSGNFYGVTSDWSLSSAGTRFQARPRPEVAGFHAGSDWRSAP